MQSNSNDHQDSLSRLRSNSYDISSTKRMRTGSISGRLRTASDLEELGYIDRKQKGIIKDLIISGDQRVQAVLDKFEKGEKEELLDLLNQGLLGHKESIDLLDGLDFDFINNLRTSEGEGDEYQVPLEDFDFGWANEVAQLGSNSRGGPGDYEKNRRGSIDSVLLNDFMFDEVNTPHTTGIFPNEQVGAGHDNNILFNDLFNHFAQDTLHTQSLSPRDKSKKSLRVPTLPSNNSATSDISPDKVDLSAYANYAASLQSNPNGNDPNRRLVASGSSPQKLAIRIKSETTKPTVASSSSASNKAGVNGNKVDGSKGYLPGSSHNFADILKSETPFPTSEVAEGTSIPLPEHLVDPSARAAAKLAGYIGAYSPEQRKIRIEKFLEKRSRRVWTRKVKYDVRKNFADSRLRIKGRFVKKEDEDIMRELLSI